MGLYFACLHTIDVNVHVHAFQPKPSVPLSLTVRRPAHDYNSITELNVASVMRSSSSKVPEKQPHDDSSNIDAAISQLNQNHAGLVGQVASSSTSASPFASSASANSNDDLLLGNMHSVLDDGQGHMNADLARAIWEWENAIRLEEEESSSSSSSSSGGESNTGEQAEVQTKTRTPPSPKVLQYPASQLKFSTRQGLRMIHEIALEVLDIELEDVDTDTSPTNYADLVQEGVVALMSAMAEADVNDNDQYDNDNDKTTTTSRSQLFEVKAREAIRDVMVKAQFKIRTPRAFPSVVFDALNHKHQSSMSSSKSKQDDELDTNTNRGLSNKATLSSSSSSSQQTVVLLEEEDQEEDTTGADVDADTTTTQSLNTALVQPLASLLQQSNPTPDEVALSDMIRHDLDGFLKRTLTPKELAVIRLKFGLEVTSTTTGRQETSCGRGWNVETIGEVMELSKEDVVELETQALEKLRMCFRKDYIGAYLDDDPATEEVSL
jgi:RNA polymerase sigma factor (sigma-70 family)